MFVKITIALALLALSSPGMSQSEADFQWEDIGIEVDEQGRPLTDIFGRSLSYSTTKKSKEVIVRCEAGLYARGNLSRTRSTGIRDGELKDVLEFVYQHTDWLPAAQPGRRINVDNPMIVEFRNVTDPDTATIGCFTHRRLNYANHIVGMDPTTGNEMVLYRNDTFGFDRVDPKQEGDRYFAEIVSGSGFFGVEKFDFDVNLENGNGSIEYRNSYANPAIEYDVKLSQCEWVQEEVVEELEVSCYSGGAIFGL